MANRSIAGLTRSKRETSAQTRVLRGTVRRSSLGVAGCCSNPLVLCPDGG